jgi:hypothetical protein
MVRRSSANAKTLSYWCGVEDPIPGRSGADQTDVLLLGVDPGLHRNLPAGAGRPVQPEEGASLRVAEFGQPDLTVIADGDIDFQLGTRDGNNHAASVAGRRARLRTGP